MPDSAMIITQQNNGKIKAGEQKVNDGTKSVY